MFVKKIMIFLILFSIFLFAGLVYSANQAQINQSLTKGINYLTLSKPEIWNATDYMALYYLKKEFNLTINQTLIDTIRSKRSFDSNQYPFINSLFEQTIIPPGPFEIGLGTPTLLHRIITCSPFNASEITNLGLKTNTQTNKYDASHSVLYLNLIKKTYSGCGQTNTANQASLALTTAVNGLSLPKPPNQNPWSWDAYLEQECSRAIATGLTDSSLVDDIILIQDNNGFEPLTFGGWYQYRNRLNEPEVYYDENGNNPYVYYSELPNAHTSIFAMCILGKASNKT